MNAYRSYRCSGTLTLPGISQELAGRSMDSIYLDIHHRYDTTIRLELRMNNVDGGYIDIPDLEEKFRMALERGVSFGHAYQKFDGELATFTGRDEDAAVLTEGTYAFSYRQYGPSDVFALRLRCTYDSAPRDHPPSFNISLSPRQSYDLLGLLRGIARDIRPYSTGELVLENGDTTPDDLAPP
jgi:hypothetical protein